MKFHKKTKQNQKMTQFLQILSKCNKCQQIFEIKEEKIVKKNCARTFKLNDLFKVTEKTKKIIKRENK